MARAPINGATLRWARELGHVGVEDLATAAGTTPSRILEFEAGDLAPTFRQLTLIATKLDRPLGFFFAVAPQRPDVPETADFRGRGDEALPAVLVREMKRAEQHREAMLDLSDHRVNATTIGAISRANSGARASEMRRTFGLTEDFTPPASQANQAFNLWRGLLEAHGYLVFQTTKIELSTFRGLSISHDSLPIILVNGADSAGGRTFTLFHEVAHLANRTSGVCLLVQDVNEEAIANGFAASFLMPEKAVRVAAGQIDDLEEAALQIAFQFKVSPLAAAVRLRSLKLIGDDVLETVRKKSEENWDRQREAQKSSDGFVPPWRLRYRDLGAHYIGVVARALDDRRIDIVDASYLLDARLPMIEQILEEYHRAGGDE